VSNLPILATQRAIPPEVWSALKNSIFPGAADDSVAMAWDYCSARQLDVMLKPVHLVPMSVKDAKTGESIYRDVVMPGIGLYRIQADRAGNYAGMSAPVFGPDITQMFSSTFQDKFTKKQVTQESTVTFPEWCELTVNKLIGERIISFTAREYWIENYATSSGKSEVPNAMWKKRPRGQLAKCTEAQALRKAWPELGSQPTAEEMEGKEIDITPATKQNMAVSAAITESQLKTLEATYSLLMPEGKAAFIEAYGELDIVLKEQFNEAQSWLLQAKAYEDLVVADGEQNAS